MAAVLSPQQWSSPADRFVSPERSGDVGEYRQRYKEAFSALSPQERYAVRDWTHVEGAEGKYMDVIGGKAVMDNNRYAGTNYDLNAYLRSGAGTPLDRTYEAASSRLHNALSKLPTVPLDKAPLLRAADVDPNYASRFSVGDHVTNGRSFMSAASNKGYAVDSIAQGYAAEGRDGGMAMYEFNSKSAVPTLPGVSTQAAHETEWLFKPYSVFRVNEMASTRAQTESNQNLPLTGMRMDEVDVTRPIMTKGLHTGKSTLVRPEYQRPPPLPDSSIPPPAVAGSTSGSSPSSSSRSSSRSRSSSESD